ncbi:hypothetical protein H0H93_007013 [Arthromyces matolae]|nr:hypothetical protein H0H93_007013 [Arthromyces matolae]
MAIPFDNIHIAFHELGRNVDVALRTQLGDRARLGEQKRLCLQFLGDVRQHVHLLLPQDFQTIQESVEAMVAALDQASSLSSDLPDVQAHSLGGTLNTGCAGRPRIDIQPDDLAQLHTGRVPHSQIAALYGCNERTIRRRLVDYEISRPGPPVYTEYEDENGTLQRRYTPGVSADLSMLSDQELDAVILEIYEQFPSFGRRMIDGYLMSLGHRVPRQRIIDSYARVVGPTTATFAPRRIQRRVYSVPGPNSLWHHDGQHEIILKRNPSGLIRWKIVIHAFIDGFSRLLLGARAHNNNRADTVLRLFEDIAEVFGYPSRVRGDHGTENLLVAARMEEVRGSGRGSYIWGRSVHNIRIERLWVDVTRGVGKKWKDFFRHLEVHDGLNVDIDAHIWLVHYLFLDAINDDLKAWAEIWNHHVLARRGELHRSPREMYMFGIQENGFRGIFIDDAVEGNVEEFGIDWNEVDNAAARNHHNEHNVNDGDSTDPFTLPAPDHLSHVEVVDPHCPFSPIQLTLFESQVSALQTFHLQDMHSRRLLWIDSLAIAYNITHVNS